VIGGSLESADIAALCERVQAMFSSAAPTDAEGVVCDVGALHADFAAVDAVARLAVGAGRLGTRILLRDAPPALRELLALAGLADVIARDPESGVDPRR
jgi:hypothetical protein